LGRTIKHQNQAPKKERKMSHKILQNKGMRTSLPIAKAECSFKQTLGWKVPVLKYMPKFPVFIVILFFSFIGILNAMPSTAEYLSNIPHFTETRNDFHFGNFLVSANDKVVIPISEDGAEINDVLYLTNVRFIFDDIYAGEIKKLHFGDGASGTANIHTNFLDHNYNITGSIQTFQLTLKRYNIGQQLLGTINFNITISPVAINTTTSSISPNVKLNYAFSPSTSIKRKPLLFIEGYAITGSTAAASIIGMNPGFFQNLLDNGYDLFILNFGEDNQNSLISNSQHVLAAINAVDDIYAPEFINSIIEPVKIIGYSMGGVLARLAMNYAEDGNFPHLSNTLITLDSPHRGMLLNENVQNMVQSAIVQQNLPASLMDMVNEAFGSPAAKQMIRNSASGTNPSVQSGSDEYRDIFGSLNSSDSGGQNLLNETGQPHKQNNVKRYAVASGANTLSGNVNNSNYFSNISLRFTLGRVRKTVNLANIPSVWYDKTPGSKVPILNHYSFTVWENNWDDFLVTLFGTPKVKLRISQSYIPVMVPTISSLCIENIPFTTGSFDNPLPTNIVTPFDDYFISPSSEYHTTISTGAANWMMNKLQAIESNPNLRCIGHATGTVYSAGIVFPGTTVSVKNIQTNETYSTTSNELGEYSFPLYYLSPCEYQITIAGDGYYASKQTLSIQPNHLGNAELPNTTLSRFNLSNIIVSPNNPAFFSSISEAMQQVYNFCTTEAYNSEPVKIRVISGTYDENINFYWLTEAGVENFTLEGIGNVTLCGNSIGMELYVSDDSQINNAVYTIRNFTITGFERGLVYKDNCDAISELPYNQHITLNVINCRFNGCGGNAQNAPEISAAAVHFEGTGVIEDCTFINNSMIVSSSPSPSSDIAGGVYVRNDSQGKVEIKNCLFENNMAGEAGALAVTGIGEVIVNNNTFRDNGLTYISEPFGMRGNDLSVYGVSNTKIQHNVFDGEQGTSVGLISYGTQPSHPCDAIIFENNTISYTVGSGSSPIHILRFGILSDPTVQDIQFRNNVFTSSVPNICRVSKSTGYHAAIFEHNILHNVTTAEASFVLNTTDPDGPLYNHLCNPMLDTNFVPIWNDTIMSPCIDTGYGDDDPDGTPRDIGAKTAQEHAYWEYSFENQADYERWYWVSYPVLNTITDNALQASEFFEELLQVHQILENGIYVDTPTYLDEIDWMEEGELQSIEWYNDEWTSNQFTHYVSSPQGYKIKLLQNVPDTVTLIESGFKTPENLQFSIHGGVENWLGYFKEDPAKPNEVFADIWDDIIMVRGKSWSLVRDSNGLSGKMGTLHYGDMVSILTTNSHTFQWGSSNPTPPALKSMPQHFAFDEKPDYIPIYVSLPDSLMPDLQEIGLYLDGVCKGAVVVESDYEQISAYVNSEDELTNSDLELIFHYDESKRPDQELRTTSYSPGKMQTKYGIAGARYPFYEVSISQKDLDNVKPPVFALKQNYPNPFNPSTTISYWLPETARVSLDIYNLKGQLVKTLIDSEMEAGPHSVVWNGKDGNNQAVASGVYFYRLSSPNNTQTKRMLLMK
jgi:hypothetical protein